MNGTVGGVVPRPACKASTVKFEAQTKLNSWRWPEPSDRLMVEEKAPENVSILAGFIHIIASLCGLVSFSSLEYL